MTTQPDPTIHERLRELAARHVRIVTSHPGLLGGINDPPSCKIDGQLWPCDARLLSVQLDTLERRVRAAEYERDDALSGMEQGQRTIERMESEWTPPEVEFPAGYDHRRKCSRQHPVTFPCDDGTSTPLARAALLSEARSLITEGQYLARSRPTEGET